MTRRWETMSCPFNRCHYGKPCKHFYRRQRQQTQRDKPIGQPKDKVSGRSSDLVAHDSCPPIVIQTKLYEWGISRHPSLLARAERYKKYLARQRKRR